MKWVACESIKKLQQGNKLRNILTNLNILEFSHVIVKSIEIGSVAAVVPPTSSVGYRTVLITSVIIIL